MIYTHVMNKPSVTVTSPLDRLAEATIRPIEAKHDAARARQRRGPRS